MAELTKADQLAICQLYITKADNVREIARAFGTHPTTVYRILHLHEVELHHERVKRKKNKRKRAAEVSLVAGNAVGYEAATPRIRRTSAPARRTLMQRIRDFFKG